MRNASEKRISLCRSSFETGIRSSNEKRALREVTRASLFILSLSLLQVEIKLEQNGRKNAEEKKWRIQAQRRTALTTLLLFKEANDHDPFLSQVPWTMSMMLSISENSGLHCACADPHSDLILRFSLH
jgi:hypothetical protein